MGKRNITFKDNFFYILEYIVVVPIGILLGILPWGIARKIADFAAWFVYRTDSKNKKIGHKNLDIIFKDQPLSLEEKNAIIQRLYRNIARGFIEYLKIGKVTKNNYRDFTDFQGYENVDQALAEKKGLIVITAHLGNWEYLGSIPAKLGRNVGVIINRQFNPYTDKWLRQIREKKGKLRCFYNEVTDMVTLVRHLKNNGIIATLVDQTYYFKPIFVPFFGRPSATADGMAKLHLKYKAPILMAFGILQPNGKYLLKFEKAVTFENTGDSQKDCEKIMTWVNQRYEEMIRLYPDQWFTLLHDRWERSKPEDFQDVEWDPF